MRTQDDNLFYEVRKSSRRTIHPSNQKGREDEEGLSAPFVSTTNDARSEDGPTRSIAVHRLTEEKIKSEDKRQVKLQVKL